MTRAERLEASNEPMAQLQRVLDELRSLLDDRESHPTRMCVGYRERLMNLRWDVLTTIRENADRCGKESSK